MKVSAIIPAAGLGQRLPGVVEKPYIRLGNRPILTRTLEQLSASERIDEIIVVVSKFNIDLCREKVVKKYNIPKVRHIISGGITRGESVYNGLRKADPQTDIILIHDGVRPFVSKSIINNSIDAAIDSGAVICAVPVISTVKQVKEGHLVEKTVDRKNLVMVQTPQVFKKDLIMKAYRLAMEKGFEATDDAALVEWSGYPVKVVMGSYKNMKITAPDDLILARGILDETR